MFDALVYALAIPLDSNGNLAPGGNGGGKRGPGPAGADPRKLAGQAATKGGAKKVAESVGLASLAAKKPAVAKRPGGQRLLFDRLFGIDPSVLNEDVVGTIPQALWLMNGPLVNGRTQARPGTVLGDIMSMAPNPRAALSTLYMRVLSRQPTTQEVEVCSKYMMAVGKPGEAFEDIYWSLINSTEFLTRR